MARQMLTPNDGQGLGPQLGGGKENPYFHHTGSNEGYKCYLVAYNNGDGAVIMTNGNNGSRLAMEILSTIAYEYKWPGYQ